eukprot:TRINITY_DN17303_c0_g1_i1.p1 TRINITY_DN17303_c0_g1~~TRINITY_DN17303_c0_g1_i1.p1  ORF type:complete len:339 (-),score=43.18 TRINITY_DN17303_c0_g1_i1:38-1054(-)
MGKKKMTIIKNLFYIVIFLLITINCQDNPINRVNSVHEVAQNGCHLGQSKYLTEQLINQTNYRSSFVFMEPLILKSTTWNIILSPSFIGVPYLQVQAKKSLESILSSSHIYSINLTKAFLSFSDQYILWKGYYMSTCPKQNNQPGNTIYERGIAIEVEEADKWEREFNAYGRGLWNRSGNAFYYTGYDVVQIQSRMILTFQQLYNLANQYTVINETSELDIDTISALEGTNCENGLQSSVDPDTYWVPFSQLSTPNSDKLTLYLAVFVPMAVVGIFFSSTLLLDRRTLWTREDIEEWKSKHYNDYTKPKPLRRLTRYVDAQDNDESEETVFNYVEIKK